MPCYSTTYYPNCNLFSILASVPLQQAMAAAEGRRAGFHGGHARHAAGHAGTRTQPQTPRARPNTHAHQALTSSARRALG